MYTYRLFLVRNNTRKVGCRAVPLLCWHGFRYVSVASVGLSPPVGYECASSDDGSWIAWGGVCVVLVAVARLRRAEPTLGRVPERERTPDVGADVVPELTLKDSRSNGNGESAIPAPGLAQSLSRAPLPERERSQSAIPAPGLAQS